MSEDCKIPTPLSAAYLAAPGYVTQCRREIGGETSLCGDLILSAKAVPHPTWCHNFWRAPVLIKFASISEAAGHLSSLQRNWVLYPFKEVRRSNLILEKLPYVSLKPVSFPVTKALGNLGSFTLLDHNTLLASADCSSPFANGEAMFLEDKKGPPSRAYLKLWELFTLLSHHPKVGERCLEIGASPGGWTWVLQKLGAKVVAIDRAELAESVGGLENVIFRKGDGLSTFPAEVGEFDWIFSDVICYPERLLEWINVWIAAKATKNIVCTIKFKGDKDYGILAEFAKIPRCWLRHLSVNKNEVTCYIKL